MSVRRYPLGDLVALMRLPADQLERASRANPFRSHLPSDNEARLMLGISGSAWKRLHTDGLDPDKAERYATRAGFHPSEVWPTWYDDELAERTVACPECDAVFVPNRKGQVYCSRSCGVRRASREYARRRYHTDPEYRARKVAEARQARADLIHAPESVRRHVAAQTAERRRRWAARQDATA